MGLRVIPARLGRYCRFLGILAFFYLNLYVYSNYSLSKDTNGNLRILPNQEIVEETTLKTPTERNNSDSEYLINTGVCSIARTEIMPAYLKKNWYNRIVPKCFYESILADLDDETQTLKLRPDFVGRNCCVHEVLPVQNDDNLYTISKCEILAEQTKVHQKEILVTNCGSKLNLEANLPNREPVKKKLEFWKNFAGVKPYSVLIIGMDSYSRSHAYRALPKSMEFMKSEMGFIDFKGYHSLAAGTIHNFMGFLAGITFAEARKMCVPTWDTPFDPCPFIWQKLSERNYVTMYVEDGLQTFNYGTQTGFINRPTDYYIHPLFSALVRLRKNISAPVVGKLYDDELQGCCTSSETVPQFLLRYTQRFTKKFMNIPSFSFTWLAFPFHSNIHYTVGNFDNDFLKFFKNLKSNPSILRDTMIVFLTDHGDRTKGKTLDGFLERSLPALFIRLPDRLEEQFPGNNFKTMLELNSERLTAPFDIHHTILHLLNMTGVQNSTASVSNSSRESVFEPSPADRTSLILPVPLNRTCETIHVFVTICACNVTTRVNTLSNPFVLNNIREKVQSELRKILRGSEYKKDCAMWELNEKTWLLQAQIRKNTTSQLEVSIQFEANPGKAQFETLIRVFYDPQDTKTYGKTELVGKFSRLSLYGAQSSCIGSKSYLDKYLKELCYCKSELKKLEIKYLLKSNASLISAH